MSEYLKQQQVLLRKTKTEIRHILQSRGVSITQSACREFAKHYGSMYLRDEIYRKRCEEIISTLIEGTFPLPIAQSIADATLQSQYLSVLIDAIISHSYQSPHRLSVGPAVKLAVPNTAGTAIETQSFVYSTLLQHLLNLRKQINPKIAKTAIEMLIERIESLERRVNDLETQLRQGGGNAPAGERQAG